MRVPELASNRHSRHRGLVSGMMATMGDRMMKVADELGLVAIHMTAEVVVHMFVNVTGHVLV